MARHSPITISSRSMPRAIRRVAAPTNLSRSPSRRMGVGRPGGRLWPLRRSCPSMFTPGRSCSSAGWTGMPSGAGRGRGVSRSAVCSAPGWECSKAGSLTVSLPLPNGVEVPGSDVPGVLCAVVTGTVTSPPGRPCTGKAPAPGARAGVGVCTNAPRGSTGSTPVWGRSNEVGCSVTRVESIRPGLRAARAVGPAETPIPGLRAPGTEFPRGQRLFLCHRRTVCGPCRRPCRCCPRTPRSRPAAPR